MRRFFSLLICFLLCSILNAQEIKTEEVTFTNIKDSVTLSGTITYPLNYKKAKKTPILVLISGSGAQDRDEKIFHHKPFKEIAEYLAQQGIATLRYDDRGYGKSTGNANSVTIQSNMEDAQSGINFLRKRKFKKIGALGHSEGGSIVPMLGSNNQIKFGVSLAGMAIKGDSLLVEQNYNAFKIFYPDSVCTNYCYLLNLVFKRKQTGLNGAKPQQVVDEIIKTSGRKIPANMALNLVAILSQKSDYLDWFLKFNPKEYLIKCKIPLLVLNGNKDSQVNAATNLNAFKDALPHNSKTVIKEYPNLNHLFLECKTGNVNEYKTIKTGIPAYVLRDIADWVNRL